MAYTPADYLSALQQAAPHIRVDQPLMDELGRVSGQQLTPDQVVHNGITLGGYADNLRGGAEDYLHQQYDPVLKSAQAGYDTTAKAAQDQADYESKQANTTADRLTNQLGYLYEQNRQNDPLLRQGIVSGANQNYKTDQEAQNLGYVGTDLATNLSNIAKTLGNARSGAAATLAGTQGQVGGQLSQGISDMLTNARSAATLGEVTPTGTTYQVVGNTFAGQNKGQGLLQLLQNPGISRFNTAGLRPVLQNLLKQYGIETVDDLGGATAPAASASSDSLGLGL